ncbi:MAG: ArnT family glycosyltransferase [Acidimicrobiales bacterium]
MTTATASPFSRPGSRWRSRVESVPFEGLWGALIAAILVSAGGVLQALNMGSAPQRLGEEGSVVDRAWTLERLGSFAPPTYWFEHPPLGWLQLSAWTWVTAAFERAPTAVAAGREAMVVAHLVSAVLLWVLARRLGLTRWAAALALVVFGLSPLAVQFHRQVFLDNVATPWILGAFVLACSPRQRLGAYAASGACLGVATLTSYTSLLVLPALAYQVWRSSHPSTRRYALTVGGSLFALAWGAYMLGAALRGQLFPGDGHPSLVQGAWAQLFERAGSGSVFDPDSFRRDTVAAWLGLDTVGPLLALLAAPVALVAVPRLRPVAIGFLTLAFVVVLPGYLPVSLVVGLLPFGALLIAGVAEHAWGWAGEVLGRRQGGRRMRSMALGLIAAAPVVAVVAAAGWLTDHRSLLGDDPDAALRDADRWIVENVPTNRRLIVDDTQWVDLVEAGMSTNRLVGYTAFDADGDVGVQPERRWQDYDVVVAVESVRAFPDRYPEVGAALRGSVVLAAFGAGEDRVEVRTILPEGSDRTATASAASGHDAAAAAEGGAELARNPSVELTPAARRALVAGQVDQRIMTTLVAVAADRPVSVSSFTSDPAEAGTGAPYRSVAFRARSDDDARAIRRLLADQVPPHRPSEIEVGPGARLTVTYPLAALS